ncbi:MAG: helix-turn-helix transcriptional regulator [Pseudomonadota bacterium]
MADSFGALLKHWRGERRMSQMELGLAANVSARHISFLESGRATPSKAMIIQLSDTLNVPRGNRNALLSAAGFAQAYAARNLEDEELRFVREAMDWTLQRHCPYPAIAFDRHWTLVRMNAVSEALLGGFGLSVGDSLLEALVDNGPFANALANRDEIAAHLVTRLRTESAFYGGDPVLDAAADRLHGSVDNDRVDSGDPPAIISAQYVANGITLSLFTTIASFGSTEDIALADLKIEFMFPADDATRNALQAQFAALTH